MTIDEAIAALNTACTNLFNQVSNAIGTMASVIASATASAGSASTSAASSLADRLLAQNAAASAGASANNALATTSTDPRFKIWRLTATTDLALSGLQIVDGAQTIAGDRIFLPVQNTRSQNGIYIAAAGARSRSADADVANEIINMYGYATEGIKNIGREYRLVTAAAITLDATELVYFTNEFSSVQPFGKKSGVIIIVGDSNRNGRPGYYGGMPLELTGVRRPLEGWTVYNMGQNGSQLSGWRHSTQISPRNRAPADYTAIENPYTDLYQVCAANPDIIITSLGINDYNSPASRATSGAAFPANLDWQVSFLLQNGNATLVLEVPQPFGGINFTAGSFSTD
ncbi:hypothetical protein [Sphingomonas sp. ERG5]|uniref:hypothetical protein n=1 Tax=Sphingomonas sp. ERG5 TaxID=1381597 RepID=UPI001269EC50|nr:hypothetical protein [Sphingomonas sp. ERG5]